MLQTNNASANVERDPRGAIRVLIVEDSTTTSRFLVDIFRADPDIEVVGVVSDGRRVMQAVQRHRPMVITMDLCLPNMDGFEATKEIMAYCPTPILVLSSGVLRNGRGKVFQAISYGAVDVIDKATIEAGAEATGAKELIKKIKSYAFVKVIRHPLAKVQHFQSMGSTTDVVTPVRPTAESSIVALGASTGGPVAIFDILRRLPADFPCSIVVVLHIARGFAAGFVDWIRSECAIQIKLAAEGDRLVAGMVYVAPEDCQTRVVRPGVIKLSHDGAIDGHEPSATALFESIAKSYGRGAIGVILTGMGRDGAKGIHAIKQQSGRTIAQDEASSIIFGMPKAAIEAGSIDRILSPDAIAETLQRWL